MLNVRYSQENNIGFSSDDEGKMMGDVLNYVFKISTAAVERALRDFYSNDDSEIKQLYDKIKAVADEMAQTVDAQNKKIQRSNAFIRKMNKYDGAKSILMAQSSFAQWSKLIQQGETKIADLYGRLYILTLQFFQSLHVVDPELRLVVYTNKQRIEVKVNDIEVNTTDFKENFGLNYSRGHDEIGFSETKLKELQEEQYRSQQLMKQYQNYLDSQAQIAQDKAVYIKLIQTKLSLEKGGVGTRHYSAGNIVESFELHYQQYKNQFQQQKHDLSELPSIDEITKASIVDDAPGNKVHTAYQHYGTDWYSIMKAVSTGIGNNVAYSYGADNTISQIKNQDGTQRITAIINTVNFITRLRETNKANKKEMAKKLTKLFTEEVKQETTPVFKAYLNQLAKEFGKRLM